MRIEECKEGQVVAMDDGRNGILTGDVVAVGRAMARVQFRDKDHLRTVSVSPRRLWCEDDQLSLFPAESRPGVLDGAAGAHDDLEIDWESASRSAGGGR